MKRKFAYITAPWGSDDAENTENAAQYCREAYDLGYHPICPVMSMPLYLHDEIPQEHKDAIDMANDQLRRSCMLIMCGKKVTERMKDDIALAARLSIPATTMEGLQAVRRVGRKTNA